MSRFDVCHPDDLNRPFKSRPDIIVPLLNLTYHDPDLLSPGYYFLAPFKSLVSVPLIYDNNGKPAATDNEGTQHLVWVGSDGLAGTEGHGPHVYDFHVCDYQGSQSSSICMLRGFNDQGNVRGDAVIMDSHYRQVKQVFASGVATSCDLHEFTTANAGTTALVTQYRRRPYDLPGRGLVWLLEGVFQELDIESGRVLFEWKSLDHVAPFESVLTPKQATRSLPWDYFHLNSVEKMPDGNYLVSSRHTSTIFKISARDGTIMWRFGGPLSSFEPMDPPLLFQHHARVLADDGETTRLSVFDNGRRPAMKPERPSAGVILQLNHKSKTVLVERRYSGPGVQYIIKVAGSTLVLPNQNVLVGFGDSACFTEYTSNGTLALKACLKDDTRGTLYRAYKSPWIGRPLSDVALVSFSRTNLSSTAFYVSWNGATEVRQWRVLGASSQSGPFEEVSRVAKGGFETTISTDKHYAAAYVEALSAEGEVLGKSAVAATLVPSEANGPHCDDFWCIESSPCPAAVETGSAVGGVPSPLHVKWRGGCGIGRRLA
ncbi:hypothetical protein QIS74_12112 [Colletotrichum tabaci]|uniref:Arylsulfotransferase n=1 Tax=Colletotrichum tabaci TaxID=1209068 RepID=A0AAV9SX11_9PEZI